MESSATTQISRLQNMGLKDLRAKYARVFGKPTKSRNRKQLFSQIAKKIQADRAGHQTGTEPAKPTLRVKFKRKAKVRTSGKKKIPAKKPAKPRPIGQRDHRLPKVGTTITKKYKGKTLNIRVMEKGFEYKGQVFRSLSGVAKHVTGAIWNGYLFLGLIPRKGKKN